MKGAEPHGVLVVDKPSAMTSHDVVARVRRVLGTRRVGHAGTLDPMATGVLVVLVGEATKLAPYLTADDKRYAARVALGRATDTLDAEGATTATAEVPAWLVDEIREAARLGHGGPEPLFPRLAEALRGEAARAEQVPPVFSAIHVDGRRSYELARAGEAVALDPRPVAVRRLDVTGGGTPEAEAPWVDLELDVAKGYYVRSLARDLGDRLGVPAHLAALRRLQSGAFSLEGAVALDPQALRGALVPPSEAAARALPVGRLGDEGVVRARQGKLLVDADFTALPPAGDASAWLDAQGRLVAIGGRAPVEADPAGGAPGFVVHRGFVA
jgi:tRNA pseudouridine55 synthase